LPPAQKFLGVSVQLQGAGRTDAGVHALAQTAHLESSRKINRKLCASESMTTAGTASILLVENAPSLFQRPPSRCQRSYRLSYCQKTAPPWQTLCLVGQRQSQHQQNATGADFVSVPFTIFASFADKG